MLRSGGFQGSGTGRAGGSGKKPKCQGINVGAKPAAYHPPICICTISCTLRSLYSERQEIPTGLEVSVSVPKRDRGEASCGKELSQQQPDFLTLFPAHCPRGINRTLIRTCHGTKTGNILTCCQTAADFCEQINQKLSWCLFS